MNSPDNPSPFGFGSAKYLPASVDQEPITAYCSNIIRKSLMRSGKGVTPGDYQSLEVLRIAYASAASAIWTAFNAAPFSS